MIDPFTAFAAAQAAVAGIKKAIELGKDINSLIGQFSSFYSNADEVHIASSKAKIEAIKKSDSQINKEALEIAMRSKALRDYEKELKDILFWSGNAPVWEEMMAERTRMSKERAAIEQLELNKKQKDKEVAGNVFLNALLATGAAAIIVPAADIARQSLSGK